MRSILYRQSLGGRQKRINVPFPPSVLYNVIIPPSVGETRSEERPPIDLQLGISVPPSPNPPFPSLLRVSSVFPIPLLLRITQQAGSKHSLEGRREADQKAPSASLNRKTGANCAPSPRRSTSLIPSSSSSPGHMYMAY